MLRAVRSPPVVLPESDLGLQYATGEALLYTYQGKWDSVRAAWRVDALSEFWTLAAEDCRLAPSHVALTNPGHVDKANPLPRALMGLQRGRITQRLLKCVNLCQRQHRATGALVPAPLTHLQAAPGAVQTTIGGSWHVPKGAVGPVRWQAARLAGPSHAPGRGS